MTQRPFGNGRRSRGFKVRGDLSGPNFKVVRWRPKKPGRDQICKRQIDGEANSHAMPGESLNQRDGQPERAWVLSSLITLHEKKTNRWSIEIDARRITETINWTVVYALWSTHSRVKFWELGIADLTLMKRCVIDRICESRLTLFVADVGVDVSPNPYFSFLRKHLLLKWLSCIIASFASS